MSQKKILINFSWFLETEIRIKMQFLFSNLADMVCDKMSHIILRKPNNVVYEQVRHKPSCTSTEDD